MTFTAPHSAVPNSDVVEYDTIQSINEPVSVNATLTCGAVVTVTSSAHPGDVVLFDIAGQPPAAAVEGTDYFTAADFATKFKSLS